MANDPRIPASVLMTLGLAGCNLFGPCLSIVNETAGPCLSVIDSGDDCDTADENDTDCPEDTAAEESRDAVIQKVLEAGTLPSDVADRVTE